MSRERRTERAEFVPQPVPPQPQGSGPPSQGQTGGSGDAPQEQSDQRFRIIPLEADPAATVCDNCRNAIPSDNPAEGRKWKCGVVNPGTWTYVDGNDTCPKFSRRVLDRIDVPPTNITG